MSEAASSSSRSTRGTRGKKKEDSEYQAEHKEDDLSTLEKEEALPQGDPAKEVSGLEDDLNLPVEEVIRRMQARAAEEGDDDDEEDEEEDAEESEGEDDEDDEDDEEGEDEDEDEEADMPLAPPSVAEILKGGKRPASSSKAPPSKPAKTAKAEAPATAAKPAAQLAAAKPSTPAAKPPAPKPVKLEGGLEYVDLQAGGGPLATRGRKVNVKYRGTLTNGKQFDEGTINFRLGGGEVIRGWDLGVAGMKVGGKRSLRIPPHLAYGKKGVPPTIPPNATLLFDVQLLKC
uniref:peptidylprolyl isomerase n=1 Tax=Haptolina brevifila TaxID=156173 RepID=A0A7S2CHK9_9EUKA